MAVRPLWYFSPRRKPRWRTPGSVALAGRLAGLGLIAGTQRDRFLTMAEMMIEWGEVTVTVVAGLVAGFFSLVARSHKTICKSEPSRPSTLPGH
jgi:hypothetical protein